MKPLYIAVVGSKKSGKTKTIEILTQELAKRGRKIAVLKHIPETNFTMDTKGKDTWRFAQAGATKIISVSPHEIATIEKTVTKDTPIRTLLERSRGSDIVFIEGFRKLVAVNRRIGKVVLVKSTKETEEAFRKFDPIVAFAGESPVENRWKDIPSFDMLKDSRKLADLIERLFINAL